MTQEPPLERKRAPKIPQTSIDEILKNPDLLEQIKFSRAETKEDRDARIERERLDHWDRRVKGRILFGLVILMVLIVVGYCLYTLTNANASLDDRKWAQTIVGSIITAFIGYLIGKGTST